MLQQKEKLISFFDSHYKELFQFGMRLSNNSTIVEDSIQDLFLKFCESPDIVNNINSPENYLKLSLKRAILKKSSNSQNSVELSSNLIGISVPSYEEKLINSQTTVQNSLAIKKCLNQLTYSQRTIITMRFYKSMDYEAISERLCISKRTVYNQVHDAMKKLRSALKE